MNFTGFQASGKSTIAKAIYYFRTIKDDIIELAKSQALDATPVYGAKSTLSIEHGITLRKALENYLREKFLRTFGSSWGMPNDMYMEYHFTKTCPVKISLENDSRYSTPNYIWITMSNADHIGVWYSKEKIKKSKENINKLYQPRKIVTGRTLTIKGSGIGRLPGRRELKGRRITEKHTQNQLKNQS